MCVWCDEAEAVKVREKQLANTLCIQATQTGNIKVAVDDTKEQNDHLLHCF